MSNKRDQNRFKRQPVDNGYQWPSLTDGEGGLPLSDRTQSEIHRQFEADSVLYNPAPEYSFTGNAVVTAKIFEDNFNRTESGIGTPSGPGYYDEDLLNGTVSTNGTELRVSSGGGEIRAEFAPTSLAGELYFDFYTVADAYYSWSGPQIFHPFDNRWHFANAGVYDEAGTWFLQTPQGVDTSLTLANNTWYTVRTVYNVVDRTQKIKVWERGTSEPATWDYDGRPSSLTSISFWQSVIYVGWWSTEAGVEEKRLDNLIVWSSINTPYNFFTADAIKLKVSSASFTGDAWFVGASGGTFTADAFLQAVMGFGSFTADARLLKTIGKTFTGNSVLVNGVSAAFTANAAFRVVQARTFYGRAILFKPQAVGERLKKGQTLHILDHRDKPLPTYLPPRIPDETEVPNQFNNARPCLPPCPGSGAGYGTGYGVNGGATVYTITHCTSGSCPERYLNTGEGWLGQGAIGTTTHCDCGVEHSQSAHVNRMWITYATIPTSLFRMRAKMIWDVGSPPNALVNVFANSSPPSVALGECDTGGAYWNNGNLIGRMSFSADGNGSIGDRSVWFQTEASSLSIDPNAISTNTFRFELEDEGQHYRAEFKSTTSDIVTD